MSPDQDLTEAVPVDVVRYRYSAVRCPHCRVWRRELVISEAGDLRCAGCPGPGRRPTPAPQHDEGATYV